MDADTLARVRAETPGIAHSTHLLACGSALPAQPVLDTVLEFLNLEAQIGGYEAVAARQDQLDAVYVSVARHINAAPQEIALVENATVAWCQAFYALPMGPGQRILTCEAEYASNYLAFLQRAKRDGVTIEVVPSDDTGAIDLDALDRAMGPDVAIFAMTWVPTSGGLVNPAAAAGEIAKRHGVPYLLDACQAIGQLRIDVQALHCDFLSVTGRKFLRGPRGTGFLYISDRWAELEPPVIDLHAASWVSRDSYTLRPDARRFENWESAFALHAGLGAAIDYADAIGIDVIEARVKHLANHARARLSDLPGVEVRDLGQERCGIVSFSSPHPDPKAVAREMKAQGFVISTSSRASTRLDFERRDMPMLNRLAPHYYNTEDDLDACTAALGACLKKAA